MTTTTPPSAPPAASAAGVRARLAQVDRVAWGRLVGLLLVSLVVAVMTWPADGTPEQPLQVVTDALLAPRVAIYLVIAVLLWLVWTFRGAVGLPAGVTTTPAPLRGLLQRRGTRPSLYLVVLAVACVVPLALSDAAKTALFSDIGLYALLALGLNVVVGYAGLLDLGFIAFFAIGAYTTAYFTWSGHGAHPLPVHAPFHLNPFFVFPIALVVAALAGVILGGPTLRLRGDYLAIVTLGFGEIVQLLANNADKVTNGPRGAFGIPHFSLHIGPINYDWTLDPLPYYYLLLAIIIIVMIAFGRLEKSRVGRAWAAIREDEVAAEASGVPTLRFKLLAFAIGASTSGFAGVLFASKTSFISPITFSLQASILVLTVVIFGGMGSLFGVVLGSVVLQGLAYYLRGKVPDTDRYLFFGAVIMAMMVFRPQGLLPSRRRSREITLSEEGIGRADALGTGVGA